MKNKLFAILAACFAWFIVAGGQVQAQSDLAKCVSRITQRLEVVGTGDFDIHKAREIIREFDFGKVPDFVNNPQKAEAFKRVYTSLSEFIDLAPNSLSGKGMKGYTKFTGGIIRSNGTDFVADVKKVFGEPNFDGTGFNKVMEQLDGTGIWKNQTDWQSPGGLIYGVAPSGSEGHRISHVFNHTIPDPTKTRHGVFSAARKDVLGVVDQGWGSPNKFHPLNSNGLPDERVWLIPMNGVGTAGETHLKIVVDAPGSSAITTAYPFIP